MVLEVDVKIIVGLGNPGRRYRDTRHNVGFVTIDEVVRRRACKFETFSSASMVAKLSIEGERVLFVKPLTFMNLSGQSVGEVMRYYRVDPSNLLIVADDVNLPLGRVRVREHGGAGGHNGLLSIIELLDTEEFPRLRVGVGRGAEDRDLADYVLARFESDEQVAVKSAVDRAADAVELFVLEGIERAMNEFNRNTEGAVTETGEFD